MTRDRLLFAMGILCIVMWIAIAYGIIISPIAIWLKIVGLIVLVGWIISWSL